MNAIKYPLAVPLALMALVSVTQVGAEQPSDYSVAQLLEPCVEGDNDARWGAAAEAECEQYIKGFIDAYMLQSKKSTVCLPEQNQPDEVRWAFMRWAHQNFAMRSMPAGKGLRAVIETKFPCK